MKKITLLFLLAILPLVGFSQTWDFTNTNDGWTNVATTKTNMADYWELTSKDGIKNPGLKITPPVPAVDVNTVHLIAITMKNKSATGPEEIRASAVTSGDAASGTKFVSLSISRGDTEYQTYYIDVSSSKWVGTVDEIKILFKAVGNTDYFGTGAEVFDIDKVEILSSIPTTLQNSYLFDTDGDTEGFSSVNGSISGPTGGILTFTPTANKFAKIEQLSHHINADVNNIVRITLKNNSALNDQLRLVSAGLAGTLTQTMSVSDATEKIYGFDLSGEAGWTGDQIFTVGIGSLVDGKAQDAGTVEINSIIFNSTVLAVDRNELTGFTLYPNPVNGRLNFNSQTDISKIEVYNLTGQRLLQLKNFSNNNSFDVSILSSGMYLVNVEDVENRTTTKKIIVSN